MKTESESPGGFPKSVYGLLIMQMGVRLVSVVDEEKNEIFPFASRLNRPNETCPSMDIVNHK
jgi:hypothetical protein